MADFEAPTGPPPPKVPDGWVARWNDQYKEWFYVNTFTKKSQWEKPTAPARPPDGDDAPAGPPPSYSPGNKPTPADTKTNPFNGDASSNVAGGSSTDDSEDARLARKLQAEEEAKARSGSAASYAASAGSHSSTGSPFPDQLPPRDGSSDKQRGFLGKLFGKNKQSGGQGGYPGAGAGYGSQPGYGQPQYGGPQYSTPPPQQYGGYPPQGGYGGYPQGGYPPQGGYYQQPPGGYYGGGYQQQPQYNNRPSGGGGMGLAGGAALGLGAGLVGGMLLENAIDHHDEQIYQDGYEAGADDGGGDFGGDF